MRLVSWKTGKTIAVCVMAIVLGQITAPVTGSARAAQELQDAAQIPPPAAPPVALPTPKPEQPTSRPPDASPAGPNVRVEITITDQAGTDPPVKKTLSLIAADRKGGSIRSKVTVAVQTHPPGPDPKNYSYENLPLNVDVQPEVLKNDLIRTILVLNYETFYPAKTTGMPAVRSVVTANQTVMLENGKPLTVSQSADAATDRKVTVEIKATIMR